MSPDIRVEAPPFPIEPEVIRVLETLWSAGHGAYLVGGGVRDALLGRPVSDWDIATDARPQALLRIFPGSSYQNRFGTVLARGMEITTFRRDHRYADHRRPDTVTFSSDIFEDLARRDLTINAIAWGRRGQEAGARFVDPADGRGDLEARLVRAVGDPNRRFEEDALRLLRAVRIAAGLEFSIEPMTWAAMVAHAGDVEWVAEERVGREIRRMLRAEVPSRAMHLLADSGILATVAPELAALPETAWARCLAGLDALVASAPGHERLALAALLGEIAAEAARAVLERLRVGRREVETITRLVDAARTTYGSDWSEADVRRYMGRLSHAELDDLLTLRAARATTDDDPAVDAHEQQLRERIATQRLVASPLILADLAVDGRDLRETLGLPEGPAIGRILERLLADVIEDPTLNTRMTLLTRASLILDELMQRSPDQRDPARRPIR